jgi:hypothetical protein
VSRAFAILFGTIAVAAIPAAIGAAVFLSQVSILTSLTVAVPVAFLSGVCGISASRRARYRIDRSVYRLGEGSLRFGRILVFTGLYASVVGALALGFYAALRAAS